jgi:pantoate--beta-alanine ligase
MIVTGSIEDVRRLRAEHATGRVGLVPTMGYLHEGHLALAQRARQETDLVVVSIYVNPAQFAPTEDLAQYPRDLARDVALLRDAAVDLVFTPDDGVMYPAGFQTVVQVQDVTQVLEGARRPTHFAGVTTVVAKLFNIVQPTHAYFGQKDAQQTVVVRRMVADLNFPVDVVICPTVREADGLAMSSRNKYLDEAQRAAGPVLYRALRAGAGAWALGERDAEALRRTMGDVLAAEPLAEVDYLSVADPLTLTEWLGTIPEGAGALASLAVRFGRTRLIDNILLD